MLTFVVLTSVLIHQGSHESKDSDERLQAAGDRIEQRLATLEQTDAETTAGPTNGAAVDPSAAHRYRRPLPVN